MADRVGERLRVAYEDRARLLEQDVAARQRELKLGLDTAWISILPALPAEDPAEYQEAL